MYVRRDLEEIIITSPWVVGLPSDESAGTQYFPSLAYVVRFVQKVISSADKRQGPRPSLRGLRVLMDCIVYTVRFLQCLAVPLSESVAEGWKKTPLVGKARGKATSNLQGWKGLSAKS